MRKRVFDNGILKERVMLIESSNDTGGAYTLLEVELQPGAGKQLHYHSKLDKRFTAVKGELVIELGRQQLRLQAGGSLFVAADRRHRFYNPGEAPIIFQVKLLPGHERFEHGLAITHGLAKDGKLGSSGLPRNIDHLAVLLDYTDTRMPGFFRVIHPLIRWRAAVAARKGRDLLLVRKYCR